MDRERWQHLLGYIARWVRGSVGVAMGILCLWLSLRGLDLRRVWSILQQVQAAWLVASLGSVICVALLKAVRWWFLYPAEARPPSWWRAFSALLSAQMLNVLVPVRLGEIARIGLMIQENVPPGVTLSTIVVEKSLDLLAVGFLLLLALPVVVFPAWFPVSSGLGMGVVGGGLLAGLAVMWLLRTQLQSLAARLLAFRGWLPELWQRRFLRIVRQIFNGLGALTDAYNALVVFLLTGGVWFFSVLTMVLMFKAFEMHQPWYVGVVLSLALTLSNLVPQPPALIGVVGAVTVVTMTWFGEPQERSAAMGLFLNVVMVSPLVVIGGWSTWMRFLGLGHLPWRERWAFSVGLRRRKRSGLRRETRRPSPPDPQ